MVALLEGRISTEGEGDKELDREMQGWRSEYEAAIEYPASRIFIALKEGKLAASGKLLPDRVADRALEIWRREMNAYATCRLLRYCASFGP